jgi:hypothetical protein
MATAVKLSEGIVAQAKVTSKALNRSIAGQIEHWAKIGKIAEENPDLSYEFIKDILIAQGEIAAGMVEEYTFTKQ